jgi:hypothetical protein
MAWGDKARGPIEPLALKSDWAWDQAMVISPVSGLAASSLA